MPAAPVPRVILEDLGDLVKRTNAFVETHRGAMRQHMEVHPDDLATQLEAVQGLFQKWNLEILFYLGLNPETGFNALRSRLRGISSRTLSLKLDALGKAGFLVRTVIPGRPVRVAYAPTPTGRMAARLTVPLIMYLAARPMHLRPRGQE